MRLPLALALAAAACLITIAACSDDDPAGDACRNGESEPCSCEGGGEGLAECVEGVLLSCDCGGGSGGGGGEPVEYRWVTSEIAFPSTPSQANSIGVDLDDDGTIDNVLGRALATLGGFFDPGDAVASGQLVQLHELVAPSLETARTATWATYLGAAEEAPDFSGEGVFTALLPSGQVDGGIADGRFVGDGGSLAFPIPIFEGIAELSVHLIRIEAEVATEGGSGMAGGAIPAEQFNGAIAAALTAAVTVEGCGPDVPCSDGLAAVLAALDTNGDYRVDPEELSGNPMWGLLIKPDIDSDDDGVADALSIGWGFTFVGATFAPPGGD